MFSRNNLCRIRLLYSALVAIACGGSPMSAIHAAEAKKVDEVVALEEAGVQVNRRESLSNEMDAASQWQSGKILIRGQWVELEQLQQQPLAPQFSEYLKMRDANALDVEGNRRMALWCQSHHMPQMATIHWQAIVAVAVDDAQARKALGHKLVGNSWLTTQELEQAAENYQHEKSCLREWMPRIRKLVQKLQSNDVKIKLEGIKEIDGINSQDAIAALKYGIMQLEPTVAVPLVSKIKSIHCIASCLALCEIALHDANSEVGRSAIEGLKQYDERIYIPELLQTLTMPVAFRYQTFYMPNGTLFIHRAYLRESISEKEQIEILKAAMLFTANVSVNSKDVNLPHSISDGLCSMFPFGLQIYSVNSQARNSIEKLSAINNHQESQKAEVWNRYQRQREGSAKFILSQISGLSPEESSDAFWNWWPAFNDEATAYKRSINTYAIDDTPYVQIPAGIALHSSCLVAGTLVQSPNGLKSIDQFKVGDEVASIDIESGEIAMRPVTLVSNRIADATFLISTKSGEAIRATGGHNWWVAGIGWVRSRDLATGQKIRTGDSSVEILKIEKIAEAVPVYNLIVDQNHTYFVGKDRLLSWDVTSLQPTLLKVPGKSDQGDKLTAH